MKRRDFLKGAGAVTILVAGGQVWRVYAQDTSEFGEGPAFEPWREWGQESTEGTLALVHAAILSANAFNTQPWLFQVSESKIEIYADAKRNLGAFDPYLREMFFSLGCALENLCLAAPPNGFQTTVSFPPGKLEPIPANPKPELAARIRLSKVSPKADELFDAIPHRHTNRSPFDVNKEIPLDFVKSLAHVVSDDKDLRVFLYDQESKRKEIVDIIWDTSRRLVSDPAVSAGTKPWYRMDMEQVLKFRDGTYVGAQDPRSAGPAPMSYPDLMMTGRLFGIIAVRDRYDRPQTTRAGRIWQRAHLFATARGLAARPANGAVEIIDHERQLNLEPQTLTKLAQLTGDASWQPTFMFYMGYATVPALASARRSVQSVLL